MCETQKVNERETLEALLDADRWIDRVCAQRDHLPEAAELLELEDRLRTMANTLRTLEAIRVPLAHAFEDATAQADTLRRRRDALAVRLAAPSSNAKELTVLDTEMKHLSELLSGAEDSEVLALLEVEPVEAEVVELKASAAPLVERRSSLRVVIEELQGTLNEEIQALRESREEAAARVPENLRARYESARKRSGSTGAARVVDGRCDACRMALSPLDFDRWRATTMLTMSDCPECGRMLIPC